MKLLYDEPAERRAPQRRPAAVPVNAAAGAAVGLEGYDTRISAMVDPTLLISTRAYNTTIALMLLWGFFINAVLCWKVGSYTNLFPGLNPILFVIGYIFCAMGGVFMTVRARSLPLNCLGYHLVVVPFGLAVSTIVEYYGGVNSAVVAEAFLYTLLVSIAVLATALVFPRAFSRLGGALRTVLLGLIVCEVFLLIAGVRQQVTPWIAAGLFSLYLGYDIHRSQSYPQTYKNAIVSALDIYLDVVNLFIRLLQIQGRGRRNS